MDDIRAHFVATVADLCAAASLAGLEVEITTAGGGPACGVPGAIRAAATKDEEVDESGYARTFRVDGHVVRLDEVLSCMIRAPGQHAASPATA